MAGKELFESYEEIKPSESSKITEEAKSKIKNLASSLVITGTLAVTSANAGGFGDFSSFEDASFGDELSLEVYDESPAMLAERIKKLCFFYSLCKADEVENISLKVFEYLESIAGNGNSSPFLKMSEGKQLSILKEVMN